jgi:hypothetical protein
MQVGGPSDRVTCCESEETSLDIDEFCGHPIDKEIVEFSTPTCGNHSEFTGEIRRFEGYVKDCDDNLKHIEECIATLRKRFSEGVEDGEGQAEGDPHAPQGRRPQWAPSNNLDGRSMALWQADDQGYAVHQRRALLGRFG